MLKGKAHNLYTARFTLQIVPTFTFFIQLNLFSIADNPILILSVMFQFCLDLTIYCSQCLRTEDNNFKNHNA